jgi:glycosyltransferase involved in cell wall biosynthesis
MTAAPGSVLLVTPRWTRDGGVATHAMTSAEALARHGVDVHVLAARVEPGESVRGVTVHHSPELFNAAASPAVRVGDAMACQPQVIHFHQFEDPGVLSFMRLAAPVVISVHGYTACTSGVYYFRPGQECTRGHGPGCVPNLLLRGCAHARLPRGLPAAYRRATEGLQALHRADLAISYSSAVDRHLSANEVSPRRVIPLFTTMAPQTGAGHAERRRVVFAGRVIAPKGVQILIRAAREVDAEFVVCGDGWGLEGMRRLARRLGVGERVHFRGWLSARELAYELAEASLLAMPALWPEPFGLVGIEALAAGRPVIASATGGVGDWLEDGVSGLYVAPGDARALARALDELLANPDRQRAMGEAGRRMVSERFTVERHVSALLDAYRSARSSWEEDRDAHPSPAPRGAGAGAPSGA